MSICVENDCTRVAKRRRRCGPCYQDLLTNGGYRMVSPEKARAHVAELRMLGWTWQGIGRTAGVVPDVPRKVLNGKSKRIRPRTEKALLTVPLRRFDNRVDATATRTHLTHLRQRGWTWAGIGEAAGMERHMPQRICYGHTTLIHPAVERALLAVPVVDFDAVRGVDPTGTRRRVEGLAWLGWPITEVSSRAGVSEWTLRKYIRPGTRTPVSLADAVTNVFKRLHMTPGPSPHGAKLARAAGCVPPLAWAGDIDDPQAKPSCVLRSDAA